MELHLLTEQEIDQQLDEAFAEYKEGTSKYPGVNLKPKDAIPQAFGFNLPGNDRFMIYLASYTDNGTKHTPTKLRPGNDIAQAIPLSISDKGSLVQLKGGLGTDPIGAISSIFDTVYNVIIKHNIKGVMFRFPVKKMKGQGAVLTRVMSRLVQQKTAGRFEVLPTPMTKGNKYAFVFIVNKAHKARVLDKIAVDTGAFEEIKINGFTVFKDKDTGKEVTKEEAKIKSVTKRINKIPETKVPSLTIKKSELVKMYGTGNQTYHSENEENFTFGADGPSTIPSNASSKVAIRPEEVYMIKDFMEELVSDEPEILEAIKNVTDSEWKDILNHETLFKVCQRIVSGASEDTQMKKLEKLMVFFNKAITSYGMDRLNDFPNEKYTKEQKAAIKGYTGYDYETINDTLRGIDEAEEEVIESVNGIDDAFEKNSEVLPKGITLYRGMTLSRGIVKNVLENKMFYFANYVSTSLKPVIFGLDMGSVDYEYNVLGNTKEIDKLAETKYPYNIGLVIGDTHKTRCINCISLSSHSHEMEILLPRGTIIKFNKIVGGGDEAFLAYVVIANDQILNETIYDGDKLFETGEVTPLPFSFSSFLNEKKKETSSSIDKMLVSLLDRNISNISNKFIN